MLLRIVAILLIASITTGQTPAAPQEPASTTAATNTITVPQGTLVALKLISSIKSKSTKAGDPVRAVVAFPLAIGTSVAIPANTFVDGTVEKVNAHPKRGGLASVELRFTRLLFANGYSVPLVATNTQAHIIEPSSLSRPGYLLANARDGQPYLGEAFATPGQTNPQPPPLPTLGPSPGKLAAIGIGASVGIMVLILTVAHHRAGSVDYLLFDSGWQFEMTLQEPLTLDAAQVSAPAATSR